MVKLRVVLAGALALVIVAALGTMLIVRDDGDRVVLSVAEGSSSPTVPGDGSGVAPTTSTTLAAGGSFVTPAMPVSLNVPPTSGLADGATVTIPVSPNQGSQLFGVDARLCRGGVSIRFDGEFIPTQGGNCTPAPLSAVSDSRVIVEGRPPFGPLDVTFRVGTGSNTFKVQSGGTATVTCDRTHPCQIVMKLQYPGGFGFWSVPVTFS